MALGEVGLKGGEENKKEKNMKQFNKMAHCS